MGNKRIFLLGNCYYSIFRFRREVIQQYVAEGYEVWVGFPNASHGEIERGEDAAKELGCYFVEINMSRRSANPIEEIKLYKRIKKLINRINPEAILTFTVKCNLYGGLLAHKYKIPYIINITGLGSALGNDKLTSRILLKLIMWSMKYASCVFFQNSHDKEYFFKRGYQTENQYMLPGSGVNIKEYKPLLYPDDSVIRFLYIARVMKEKGIDEYIELAKYFEDREDIEFHICGDCEEAYESILHQLEIKKIVQYHQQVSNVIDYEKIAHCIVLPSFYNEGMSNSLLEAAACGRPIITTDHPGCRETIEDGVSGYLVQVQDSRDLIEKVNKFLALTNDEKRNMGLAGRKKMEKDFDRTIVVNCYSEKLKEIIKRKGKN